MKPTSAGREPNSLCHVFTTATTAIDAPPKVRREAGVKNDLVASPISIFSLQSVNDAVKRLPKRPENQSANKQLGSTYVCVRG